MKDVLDKSFFLTHSSDDHENSCIFNVEHILKRLQARTDLVLPFEKESFLVKQMSEFALGRFLLHHGGLNGYWTTFLIRGHEQNKEVHPLEQWFLHKAPAVLATRERFFIFQKILQGLLEDESTLASVPCGTMDDLLSLDIGGFKEISFVGIDLDPESLKYAQKESIKHHKESKITLFRQDAWKINFLNKFDVITSNGLNIYEKKEKRKKDLYKKFFKAIKPGGHLLTSFLTPPGSGWVDINQSDLILQQALFCDIIEAKWLSFETPESMIMILESVGFRIVDIFFDSKKIFPSIVARKPVIAGRSGDDPAFPPCQGTNTLNPLPFPVAAGAGGMST